MLAAKQFMTQNKPRPNTQKNPYLVQKIMSASPEQLVSYVYDAGIKACSLENRSDATRAVQVLINALDFDQKEMSLTFFNVYRYINYTISQGNFAEAKRNLEDLKSTWTKAMKVV
ncbi:MAG: flagellar protein FliS [Calditrichaeota bacterium]|nr:MAG: flagellar protein FliS [Calditrichota bacterium]MBL1203969.1 flagellar protein FliS [Calditrichota bacterium]NOG43800.1 flagellar protein FliS [Calditrichota bacterium]